MTLQRINEPDFFKEMELNLKEQGFKREDLWKDNCGDEFCLGLHTPVYLAERERIKLRPLTLFLKKVFPRMTIKQGEAVWWLIHNKKLIVNRKDISGSFRYNGACISEVVEKGTDYMSFYMSYPKEESNYSIFTVSYAMKLYVKIFENKGVIRNLK